ncbi:MAG: GH3 auxin-responsive promoter family protein [Candidatus Obscuribacterales bacterium]
MIRRAMYRAFASLAEGKIRALIAASEKPREVQEAKLFKLLQKNAESQFGRDHNFSSIKSVADYQRAVPIRDYEDFRPYIEKATAGQKKILTVEDPLMFATTSGTTAQPKYIPITPGYMEEFRLASVASGYHIYRSFPNVEQGVALSVVSPAVEGHTEAGIPYGAISGQLFQKEPYWVKKYISPIPYQVFLIRDYEIRYYTLLRLALVLPISCFYTLNPSTISLLLRRLKHYAPALIEDVRKGTISPPGELSAVTYDAVSKFLRADPKRADFLNNLLNEGQFVAHKIWPTLELVTCWTKAAAAFYLADFPEQFGSIPVCDITYGASEGRGTVFMGPGKQMLALQSHFFEFVPEAEMGSANPTILLADQLEVGQHYFILFSTSGGLYRYNINDVVVVTGFYNRTPMLEFQYKGGNISSFTGEKITELQVTASVVRAAKRVGRNLRFFTVIPQFRPEPHYEVWIEPDSGHEFDPDRSEQQLAQLAQALDDELAIENVEYKTKRDSLRLENVEARLLTAGSYENFRKYLTSLGVGDAQIKVSHLNPKAEARQYFESRLVTIEGAQQALSGH